jgi:hypothetical protein
MDDYIWSLVGKDHVGAGFVAGGDIGGFADAVNHSDNWVMPAACAEALHFRHAENLVVPIEVKGGIRNGFLVDLKTGVGGDLAARTATLLSRVRSYLNEEAASHNGCKVWVGEGCVSIGWDGRESVRVSAVGVVHGCVARVVRGIKVMTQGCGLEGAG